MDWWLKHAGLALGMMALAIPSPASTTQSTPLSQAQVLGAEQWDMTTSEGRTYRIFIMPPVGVANPQDFPVLFVLDANLNFATAASQALLRTLYGETRPAMIVGIGYPFNTVGEYVTPPRPRNRDLTPRQPATAANDGNVYGGADAFFEFIDRELRPELKRRYPAMSDRDQWLFGHSLGGLFALHTMMSHPAAFRGYIAASPSLWFNPEAQREEELAFAKALAHGTTFPSLLLTVGGKEALDADVTKLAARLDRMSGASGQFTFKRFPEETHMSTIPAAISVAIGFAFPRPNSAAVGATRP